MALRRAWMLPLRATAVVLALATPFALAAAATGPSANPPHGVVGVEDAQLDPGYWVARHPDPDAAYLDRPAIDAHNATLRATDRSVHDLQALPRVLAREQVAQWVGALSAPPSRTLYDVQGAPLPPATLAGIVANAAVASIPAERPARYGLAVRRADLRTFPTALRVFREVGDTDIDRFQESTLFPGDPVVIAHESVDGQWWFVVSPRYAAWVERRHIAEGDAGQVLGHATRSPYRIVTGATAHTVYNPELPAVSELQLDMGVRMPLRTDWPADRAVHGQHPYASHVVDLPTRDADGRLRFAPALLPRREDTAAAPLALTPRNLIGQSFKFLGERYGWGHAYNGRDCSGFVSEVYRSLGVELPRNTSDQARSPALAGVVFGERDGREAREAAVRALQVGDLVYIPGHVMMVIGHVDGAPYVIHDTTGISYRGAGGALVRMPLNQVAVTPLLPLMFNARERTVDRITAIRHVRHAAR